MSKSVRRLFKKFQPHNYQLFLSIDNESMLFHGKVVIKGSKTGRPSKRITLHQKQLKITSASIHRRGKHGKEECKIDRVNYHSSYDEVRLHTSNMLYPGDYELMLEFTGTITRAMNGMYPCFFTNKGHKKKLIATQFESHHAREVFPGIDEPEAKATFELTLETAKGETVISNTPVKHMKKSNIPNRQIVVFETTPIMSSYLLAFVSGELEYLESKTKSGVTVRTYATPSNVKHTQFALDVAVKCLEFYDEYFGIKYPLEKCDLIALPDFASGAMENWGCITFREQTMLVDKKNTGLASKQYVAMVVGHELAHQWFGNLVTMRWWTDLWLNEGFASWIEFLAVDTIFPEWQMWIQFNVDEQQQALKLDALENTHPIEVPVQHPDEIRSIFDAISYSKGASIIHMLYKYLGPEKFRGGLRHYLERHAYGNTDTVDLWQALEDFSGHSVKSFMQLWTNQAGYPLLRINNDDDEVRLSQDRFLMNPSHGNVPKQIWPLPLLANNSKLPDQLVEESLIIKLSDGDNLLINQGRGGFYRTAYNTSHLARLGELIKKGRVSVLDRLGLLGDVFETSKTGESDTADALQFLKNFANENNYAVWEVIASSLGNVRLILGDDKLRDAMKPFIRHLTRNELDRLGWERRRDESHFDSLLRPIILGLSASTDEPSVIKKCQQIFNTISKTVELNPDLRTIASSHQVRRGIDIDPDMRGVVFGTIARLGNKADFDKLVAIHNSSPLSEERVALAAAITGFKQPSLIQKSLAMIKTDDVRMQDVSYWIAYAFLNRHAAPLAWDWVKDNWQWLEENLGNDLSFYRIPIYVARVQSELKFGNEYKAFFSARMSPALERSYKQGLEMIEWQSAWKAKAYKEVLQFFKSNPQ